MGTEVVGVSNYHVLALDLSGATISLGEAIMQPSPGDLWSCIDYIPNDRVGGLADFEPIQFCSCGDLTCLNANSNVVDAAIFDPKLYNPTLTDKIDNATLSDGYGMPKSNTISPAINMNVQKYGRTTGQTTGQISAINTTVDVQYPNGLCARFVDQIVITPGGFSAGGDSGSLIVVNGGDDDRRPVGLLFAGSPSITVANPIDEVLAAFPGLTVDGE